MGKRALFIANSLDIARKFQHLLQELGMAVSSASAYDVKQLALSDIKPDLVVFEARVQTVSHLEQAKQLAQGKGCPLLVVVDAASVGKFHAGKDFASDFVMVDASYTECLVRARRLLKGHGALDNSNVIDIDNMSINLDTYHVTVGGTPLDFTYLEYALLAFLVQHPDRTFSREALLQNVWGFGYYGGSRTVDVHVRRIRAKLGPNLAQRLETVRGVGYFWRSI